MTLNTNRNLFSVTDDNIILRTSSGVYKQARVARRGADLYATVGAGFVRLYQDNTTSSPTLRWECMEGEHLATPDTYGRLVADRFSTK